MPDEEEEVRTPSNSETEDYGDIYDEQFPGEEFVEGVEEEEEYGSINIETEESESRIPGPMGPKGPQGLPDLNSCDDQERDILLFFDAYSDNKMKVQVIQEVSSLFPDTEKTRIAVVNKNQDHPRYEKVQDPYRQSSFLTEREELVPRLEKSLRSVAKIPAVNSFAQTVSGMFTAADGARAGSRKYAIAVLNYWEPALDNVTNSHEYIGSITPENFDSVFTNLFKDMGVIPYFVLLDNNDKDAGKLQKLLQLLDDSSQLRQLKMKFPPDSIEMKNVINDLCSNTNSIEIFTKELHTNYGWTCDGSHQRDEGHYKHVYNDIFASLDSCMEEPEQEITIVLDSSRSMGFKGYADMKNFVRKLIMGLPPCDRYTIVRLTDRRKDQLPSESHPDELEIEIVERKYPEGVFPLTYADPEFGGFGSGLSARQAVEEFDMYVDYEKTIRRTVTPAIEAAFLMASRDTSGLKPEFTRKSHKTVFLMSGNPHDDYIRSLSRLADYSRVVWIAAKVNARNVFRPKLTDSIDPWPKDESEFKRFGVTFQAYDSTEKLLKKVDWVANYLYCITGINEPPPGTNDPTPAPPTDVDDFPKCKKSLDLYLTVDLEAKGPTIDDFIAMVKPFVNAFILHPAYTTVYFNNQEISNQNGDADEQIIDLILKLAKDPCKKFELPPASARETAKENNRSFFNLITMSSDSTWMKHKYNITTAINKGKGDTAMLLSNEVGSHATLYQETNQREYDLVVARAREVLGEGVEITTETVVRKLIPGMIKRVCDAVPFEEDICANERIDCEPPELEICEEPSDIAIVVDASIPKDQRFVVPTLLSRLSDQIFPGRLGTRSDQTRLALYVAESNVLGVPAGRQLFTKTTQIRKSRNKSVYRSKWDRDLTTKTCFDRASLPLYKHTSFKKSVLIDKNKSRRAKKDVTFPEFFQENDHRGVSSIISQPPYAFDFSYFDKKVKLESSYENQCQDETADPLRLLKEEFWDNFPYSNSPHVMTAIDVKKAVSEVLLTGFQRYGESGRPFVKKQMVLLLNDYTTLDSDTIELARLYDVTLHIILFRRGSSILMQDGDLHTWIVSSPNLPHWNRKLSYDVFTFFSYGSLFKQEFMPLDVIGKPEEDIYVPAVGKISGPKDDETADGLWKFSSMEMLSKENLKPISELMCQPPPKKLTCKVYVDLAILIDGSASVGYNGFLRSLNFIKSAATVMEVAPGKTRVGMIQFSKGISNTTKIDLQPRHSSTLVEEIQATSKGYLNGDGTFIANGLHEIYEMLWENRRWQNQNGEEMEAIVLILTDGQSMDDPSIPIQRLKSMSNLNIYAIGVGKSTNEKELQEMATKPEYVKKVDSTEDLVKIKKALESQLCDRQKQMEPEPQGLRGQAGVRGNRQGGVQMIRSQKKSVRCSEAAKHLPDYDKSFCENKSLYDDEEKYKNNAKAKHGYIQKITPTFEKKFTSCEDTLSGNNAENLEQKRVLYLLDYTGLDYGKGMLDYFSELLQVLKSDLFNKATNDMFSRGDEDDKRLILRTATSEGSGSHAVRDLPINDLNTRFGQVHKQARTLMHTAFPSITEDNFDDVDAIFILSTRKGNEQDEECFLWNESDEWCPAEQLEHKNFNINKAIRIAKERNIKFLHIVSSDPENKDMIEREFPDSNSHVGWMHNQYDLTRRRELFDLVPQMMCELYA